MAAAYIIAFRSIEFVGMRPCSGAIETAAPRAPASRGGNS
jgi:hypothetical protein